MQFITMYAVNYSDSLGGHYSHFTESYKNPILDMLYGIFKLDLDIFGRGLSVFLAAYSFIIIGSIFFFHQQLFRLIKRRQIRKLAESKEIGAITENEFDSKKKDLLDKM